MRRFYTPRQNFSDSQALLGPDETRHLRDVLRLTVGDAASVFDGDGREFACTVESVGKRESVLRLSEPIEPPAPESPLTLTLAASLLKGDKFDLVTQKAVELGVTRLVPIEAKRSEARAVDGEKRRQRWQKIAVAATKQCGRATLLRVEKPVTFGEYARQAEAPAYFFTERDGASFSDTGVSGKLTVFIGPEGGWDDGEIQTAREREFELVTLGGRILRAETAAIAITAVLQHRFGDFS